MRRPFRLLLQIYGVALMMCCYETAADLRTVRTQKDMRFIGGMTRRF